MQVQVVERTQQIQLQDQEISRKEMELEARIKKPADAERYRLEKLAEAERWVMDPISPISWWSYYAPHPIFFTCRLKLITEAEAEAESIRVSAHPEIIKNPHR